MAKDYRVFVHLEALDALPKSGKKRAAVIRYLQILGQIAHLGGDYIVDDPETGRPTLQKSRATQSHGGLMRR